jgi:hypothetical protein
MSDVSKKPARASKPNPASKEVEQGKEEIPKEPETPKDPPKSEEPKKDDKSQPKKRSAEDAKLDKTLSEVKTSAFMQLFSELIQRRDVLRTTQASLHGMTRVSPRLGFLLQNIVHRAKRIVRNAQFSSRTRPLFQGVTHHILVWGMLAELRAFISYHFSVYSGKLDKQWVRHQVPSDIAALIGGLIPLQPREGRPGLVIAIQCFEDLYNSPAGVTALGALHGMSFTLQDLRDRYSNIVRILKENHYHFSEVHDSAQSLLATGTWRIGHGNTYSAAVVSSESLSPSDIILAIKLRLYQIERVQSWLAPRLNNLPGNDPVVVHLTTSSYYHPIEEHEVDTLFDQASAPGTVASSFNLH